MQERFRKGIAGFILLFLVVIALVFFFLIADKTSKVESGAEAGRGAKERIAAWERSLQKYFAKQYPNLKCYCTVGSGKKRKRVELSKVLDDIISVCEATAKKYPEEAPVIKQACLNYLLFNPTLNSALGLRDLTKETTKWREEQQRELQNLESEIKATKTLLEKYGLIAAVVGVISFSLILAGAFGLGRRIKQYLELEEHAKERVEQAEREAGELLYQAQKEAEAIRLKAEEEAQRKLAQADAKAGRYIVEAREQAEEIVEQAKRYAEELKERALQEAGEELLQLRAKVEELEKEVKRLRSNLNNPVYLASEIAGDEDKLQKFVRALVKQGEAEKVQRELRRALRKKT
jgi:F0F1-type ATP synthase membrane subunit b/b'